MKRYLLLLILLSCEGTSLEKIYPKYVLDSKKIISKTTIYIHAKVADLNLKDPFFFSVKKFERAAYLDVYPHGIFVDKNGAIYLLTLNIGAGDYSTKIIKVGNNKNSVIRLFPGYFSDIVVLSKNKLVLAGPELLVLVDQNFTPLSKIYKFDDYTRPPKIFSILHDEIIYRYCDYISRIDIKKAQIVRYRIGYSIDNPLNTYEKEMIKKDFPKIEYFISTSAYQNVRGDISVFSGKNIGSAGFRSYCVGIDSFGNEYYAYTSISSNSDTRKLEPTSNQDWNVPTDDIAIRSFINGHMWKIRIPNEYGPSNDVNALGSRSFFISPSGIIYVMTVTLTHLHLDKYVPEPIAKKAGGADKAYY
jgi:hypothetical protein